MFDLVSDLHFDNGMAGSPPGLFGRLDVLKYKTPEARVLLVAGDTGESFADAVDYYNNAAQHYELVVAILGNHERMGPTAPVDDRVKVLDIIDHVYRQAEIAYVGGCPVDDAAAARVAVRFAEVQADPEIERVVLMTHYVPSLRFSEIAGRDIANKSIAFLETLSRPVKPTLLVFGHVHLRFEGSLDGFDYVANPRGYRGKLRDGSTWSGSFRFER